MKKRIVRKKYLALTLVGTFLIISSFFLKKSFYLNLTESIPVGLYKVVSYQNLKPGDFVAFSIESVGMVLMKEVIGGPGDLFCVSEQGRASVNENTFGFRIK